MFAKLKKAFKDWRDKRAVDRMLNRPQRRLNKKETERLMESIRNPPPANEKLKQLMRDGQRLLKNQD